MDKVFISQPVTGLTKEEIKADREKAIKECKNILGEDIEILQTIFDEEEYPDTKPLEFVGKDIEILANAKYFYSATGWEHSKGCRVERLCAQLYNISIINDPKVQSEIIKKKEMFS